jgi:hypothetical protein
LRDGLRMYEADTHVDPAAETLERYVDASSRPGLAVLARYCTPMGLAAENASQFYKQT